jgi:hypothetical protein
MTNETVTDFGRNEVGQEEKVVEDALCTEHECPEKDGWLTDGHERHEVHPLILGFLEQRVDPTTVVTLTNGVRI